MIPDHPEWHGKSLFQGILTRLGQFVYEVRSYHSLTGSGIFWVTLRKAQIGSWDYTMIKSEYYMYPSDADRRAREWMRTLPVLLMEEML